MKQKKKWRKEDRKSVVRAVKELEKEGINVPIVSGGSTPSAAHIENWEGFNEIHPGNYVFFDIMQYNLKACELTDVIFFFCFVFFFALATHLSHKYTKK